MTRLFQILLLALCFLAVTAYAGKGTPLHDAIEEGNKAKIEALLAQGVDVNAKDNMGRSPLNLALLNQDRRDIVELLLSKGADINAKNIVGWTPLHVAGARKRDIAELLLAKGADINTKNTDGGTPLHTAAQFGNRDVAELLIAKGADINAKDRNGRTPLYFAVKYDKRDVVDLMDAHLLEQAGKKVSSSYDLLRQLTEQMRIEQLMNEPVDTTRRLIVKLASRLKPAPVIPEEARRHFVEGATIVKAGRNPAEQALAAQSFNEALKIAPWWPDAWYNLAVAQELAGQFDEAEKSFTLYILSNPGEAEQREAQDRIYALSAKRKLSK